MSVTALTTDIRSQMIELAADRLDLKAAPALRQDRLLEPVVQVIRQHFDQQEQLVAFEVSLAVLVESKAFLELIDLVLDIAALIVVVEDLDRCHRLNIGNDELVAILHGVDIHLLLLFVFDGSWFADQNESVAFLPFGQTEMAFVDTESLVDIGPGIKMILVVDAVDEDLQTLVLLAFDDKFKVLLIQILKVVDVKPAAVDPDPFERPFSRNKHATFSDECFQFMIGVVLAILQGQVDDFVGQTKYSDFLLE